MQWIIYCLTALATALPVSPAHGAERSGALGLWVWRPGPIQDEKEGRELIDFCHRQGFDTILLQIHCFPGSQPPQLENPDGLQRLLGWAAEAGIRVEALDGSSDKALPQARQLAMDRLNAVLDFQARLPKGIGFCAFHYDIEPYTLPEWKASIDQARGIARDMLETFTLLRGQLRFRSPGMQLKFDIPAWFDHRLDLAIDFAGATKPLSEHIQDIADEIVLMSYRRAPSGPNSVESLGRDEMAYAAQIGKKASLALETIPLKQDAQISFYGVPPAQFRDTVRQLFSELGGRPGFGGVYVHQYDRLKVYLADTEPLFPPAHE